MTFLQKDNEETDVLGFQLLAQQVRAVFVPVFLDLPSLPKVGLRGTKTKK